MVGKCSHYASLLCLLILLLTLEEGSAHFDIGGQAFLGILTGKKKQLGSRSLQFTDPVHPSGEA
jgi:hypothetical protein